jgi:hypothetical protein
MSVSQWRAVWVAVLPAQAVHVTLRTELLSGLAATGARRGAIGAAYQRVSGCMNLRSGVVACRGSRSARSAQLAREARAATRPLEMRWVVRFA